jgi:hypothetical protein
LVQVAGSKLHDITAIKAKELLDGLDKVVELLQSRYHGCHGMLERLRDSQTTSNQLVISNISRQDLEDWGK